MEEFLEDINNILNSHETTNNEIVLNLETILRLIYHIGLHQSKAIFQKAKIQPPAAEPKQKNKKCQ